MTRGSTGRSSAWRRTIVARLGTLAVRVGFAAGRLRPARPYVVLASSDVQRMGENQEAISEQCALRLPDVRVVRVGYRTRHGIAGRARSTLEAVMAGYHLASARCFVVDDFFFPMYAIRPRRGTVRAQVWHAAGAFKKFGYSVLDKSFGADDLMANLVPMHTNYDICLVSSAAAVPFYAEAFRQPVERFTSSIGIPRTDALVRPGAADGALAALRARYAIPEDRRILLFAPTFRGDRVDTARFDDSLDLAELHARIGDTWTVLLRRHPFVRAAPPIPRDLVSFVIDVSDWPDMNDLLLAADLLVTDYSSAIFDYALLGRPIVHFAPDIDAYESERGFYIDVTTGLPGPVFGTTRDLAAHVAAGRFDLERVRAFAATWFEVADGHAAERFVEQVVVPALRGDGDARGEA